MELVKAYVVNTFLQYCNLFLLLFQSYDIFLNVTFQLF